MLTAARLQALGLDASWLDPLNATFDQHAHQHPAAAGGLYRPVRP